MKISKSSSSINFEFFFFIFYTRKSSSDDIRTSLYIKDIIQPRKNSRKKCKGKIRNHTESTKNKKWTHRSRRKKNNRKSDNSRKKQCSNTGIETQNRISILGNHRNNELKRENTQENMSRKNPKYKWTFFCKPRNDNINWCKKYVQEYRHDHDLWKCRASTKIYFWKNLRKDRVVEEISYDQCEKSDHRKQDRWGSWFERKLSKS